MAEAVDAANDLVARSARTSRQSRPVGAPGRPGRHVEAARLYGRRGSVQGIAAFADLGVSLLPRLDPEVRSLLELGEYQQTVDRVSSYERAASSSPTSCGPRGSQPPSTPGRRPRRVC